MGDWQPALQELASAASVETRYWEVDGTEHIAPPEVLVAILATLGIEIERPEQAPAALRGWRASTWRRALEPCAALIAGQPAVLSLRVPYFRTVLPTLEDVFLALTGHSIGD